MEEIFMSFNQISVLNFIFQYTIVSTHSTKINTHWVTLIIFRKRREKNESEMFNSSCSHDYSDNFRHPWNFYWPVWVYIFQNILISTASVSRHQNFFYVYSLVNMFTKLMGIPIDIMFKSRYISISFFQQHCFLGKLNLPHQTKNTGYFNILRNLIVLIMNTNVQVSCYIIERQNDLIWSKCWHTRCCIRFNSASCKWISLNNMFSIVLSYMLSTCTVKNLH